MAIFNTMQAWNSMAGYLQEAVRAQGGTPEQFRDGRFSWLGAQAPRGELPRAVAARMLFGNDRPSQQQFQHNALAAARVLPFGAFDAMPHRNTATASVVSPGQTQVVRPSQQPARRPSAPQAGAASSMLTEMPTPGEVGLGMTSLLGG